ncbi:hypothetical protein AMELA_G00023500 [Ameiurus melas]|uniref:Platelet endothelial cell adhesion molecule n=1 Tax=Ameiurus melas TaxID=219545 RepID=A0A7J6BEC0_AMEME|nr:hypothetical protein AMELA_G00023500 [Ameiurus melas]
MMERWPFWPTMVFICFLTLWHDGEAEAGSAFTIDWVKLTLLPGTTMERGSKLTLRCEVKVSHSSSQLMHTLKFLMDGTVIYSKNTSEAMVEYNLFPARASHSGLYECQVQIFKKEKSSKKQRLTVTGLQTPQLKVQPNIVTEGDEIMATCSAPEEIGGLYVYFYKNGQELQVVRSKDNSVTINVKVQESGNISLHCNYIPMLPPSAAQSNNSNTVSILLQELEITPSIRIHPNVVVEGDRVQILCNVSDYSQSGIEVFLTKDTVLHKDHQTFSHSFMVTANDSGEYVCKTERGNVQKISKAQLQVAELFSTPTLSMTPENVLEGQHFSLSCRNINISQTQITAIVKYSLYKDNNRLIDGHVFNTTASTASSGNYLCKAAANGITKVSTPLVINVKVPVSAPVFRTVGKIIIGQPFQLQCESEHGTLPITYTLLKFQKPVAHMTVTGPQRSALFNISSISHRNESHSFICLAEMQGSHYRKYSPSLNTPIIETVSRPELTLKTKGYVFTEGMDLILYCSVQRGTVPITFSWYRNGVGKPLNSTRISKTEGSHIIKSLTRDDEGQYYCQASNDANEPKKSRQIHIEVNLASWKKVLSGVSCIFLLVLIVIILVIFLKKAHTPRKRKRAVELSVKPARPKSEDPMRVSLTLDFEDNTAGNATPGIMGRNVWHDHVSSSESDEECKKEESEKSQNGDEPSIQNVDSGGELVMHDTETVKDDFLEMKQDEAPHVDIGLEYVQRNNCELKPE